MNTVQEPSAVAAVKAAEEKLRAAELELEKRDRDLAAAEEKLRAAELELEKRDRDLAELVQAIGPEEAELAQKYIRTRTAELHAKPVGPNGQRLTSKEIETIVQAEFQVARARWRNRVRPGATGRRGTH